MRALACASAALAILTVPLGPRGHLNTRLYRGAPRWQVELFNALVLLLTFAALVVTVLALMSISIARPIALATGVVELGIIGLDQSGTFPRAEPRMPALLAALELADLALAAITVVLAIG